MSTWQERHEDHLPTPVGPFTDAEAHEILQGYRKDPSSLVCPTCGPGELRVLAFIEPEIDAEGFASMADPEGDYAAAVYCRKCERAIGIRCGAMWV